MLVLPVGPGYRLIGGEDPKRVSLKPSAPKEQASQHIERDAVIQAELAQPVSERRTCPGHLAGESAAGLVKTQARNSLRRRSIDTWFRESLINVTTAELGVMLPFNRPLLCQNVGEPPINFGESFNNSSKEDSVRIL